MLRVSQNYLPHCGLMVIYHGTKQKIRLVNKSKFLRWPSQSPTKKQDIFLVGQQFLGGGWTNPSEKYASKWVHLPQFCGVNIKKHLKPHPGFSQKNPELGNKFATTKSARKSCQGAMLGSLVASNNMRTISTEPLLEASWRAEPPCQRSPIQLRTEIVTKME